MRILRAIPLLGLAACSMILSDKSVLQKDTQSPEGNPIAHTQSIATFKNTAKTFSLIGSGPASAGLLSYEIVTNPSNGVLSGSDASRTYTPDADFVGSDSLTFRVKQGEIFSSIASVTIDVTDTRIFLRSSSDTPVGNDATGAINDPAKPFLTAQAAVDAALGLDPSQPIIIDVGSGSFGSITLTQDFGEHIYWSGVSTNLSIIGDVSAIGSAGAAGAEDGFGGHIDAQAGGNGSNLVFNGEGISFGTINVNGGEGGPRFCDEFWTCSGRAGDGGDAGDIEIGPLLKTGDLYAVGGASNSDELGYGEGGSGGDVLVDGESRDIFSHGGYGNSSGGQGGTITVNGIARDIAANGGAGDYNDPSRGGGIVVVNGEVRNARALGGAGYMSSHGGSVLIDGVVTANVVASAGTSMGYGANGGNVVVNGRVHGGINVAGSAGSFNGYAGLGGSITLNTGAQAGTLNLDAGSGGVSPALWPGPYTRPLGSGGELNIAAGASAGNVSARGSDASDDHFGGHGGLMTLAGTTSGNIDANGGTSQLGTAGNGGTLTVSGSVTGFIFAQAGSGLDVGSVGGNGGDVTLLDEAFVNSIYVTAGSGHASGGTGGSVDVQSGARCNFVEASSGDSEVGPGQAGGSISVASGAITGNLQANGGSSLAAAGGDGGSVILSLSAISLSDPTPITVTLDPGTGTPNGNPTSPIDIP